MSGLGVHTISCYATNQAVDGNGAPTISPTQTWSVKIGEPVHIYAGFSKVTRRCHGVRERVRKRIKRVRRAAVPVYGSGKPSEFALDVDDDQRLGGDG